MLESGAAQFFLYVASVCVIVLTLVLGIVCAYLIRLVIEARSFLRKIRLEAERLSRARRATTAIVRALGAWVSGKMR